MSVAALIGKMLLDAEDESTTTGLKRLQRFLKSSGLSEKKVAALGLGVATAEEKG